MDDVSGDDELTPVEVAAEEGYNRGYLSAWSDILMTARKNVGARTGTLDRDRDSLLAERARAIVALRKACLDIGADTDWPDDLHLVDIIEKKLMRDVAEQLDL
jgi:hypothetical protein